MGASISLRFRCSYLGDNDAMVAIQFLDRDIDRVIYLLQLVNRVVILRHRPSPLHIHLGAAAHPKITAGELQGTGRAANLLAVDQCKQRFHCRMGCFRSSQGQCGCS